MKKAEKIVVVIAILAIVLKFLLMPGSGILIVLSLSFLSLLYGCLGFALFNDIQLRSIFKKESYHGLSPKKIIGTIGLGFSLSEIVLGILYKLKRWPSPDLYLKMGLFFTAIILIVALVEYSRNESSFYKGIFARIVIIGFLGLITLEIPNDYLSRVLHPNEQIDTNLEP